jgi:short-subunit dehydrogenase
MANRFAGKRVFITGASSGIGAAVARALAYEGARVALSARRVEQLEGVAEKIRGAGGEALCLPCDVTQRASIDAAVAQAVDAFGGLDIVLANAGFGVGGKFERLSTDDFRRQFETNFFGVVDTLYAALPHLKTSRGQVGIVSSVSGRLGTPTTSAYSASKFALCGLAESIYGEFAAQGVSVTLINPGFVASEIRHKDNREQVHLDRKDPAPAWLVVPAEKAAAEILSALHRRKFEAVITGHGKTITFIARHFPRVLRAIIARGARGR